MTASLRILCFCIIFKTNGFHFAMGLYSKISQLTSKCGKNISTNSVAPHVQMFLLHFDVICDLLLGRCMATLNLFINCMQGRVAKVIINFPLSTVGLHKLIRWLWCLKCSGWTLGFASFVSCQFKVQPRRQ